MFAHPYFENRWLAGERIMPDFWGPLATATDGIQEAYLYEQPLHAALPPPPAGRLVQYFDKGRMELDQGNVTMGALPAQMILGQVDVGLVTIKNCPPPAVNIAGDNAPRNPTYASVASQRKDVLAHTTDQTGAYPKEFYTPQGQLRLDDPLLSLFQYTSYNRAGLHNIPKVFADYRDKINQFRAVVFPEAIDRPNLLQFSGDNMIGIPISEPFLEMVYVNGVRQPVYIQIFSRRVLTYTAANPDPFKVEMGNDGQHFYYWRYVIPFCQ